MANVETETPSRMTMSTMRVCASVVGMVVVFAALLFIPAGRVDWTLGWVYLGIVTVFVMINYVCLRRWNPELIERRMRFGQGTKKWDIVWAVAFAPAMIAVYVVAGLEARRGAASLPMMMWLPGMALFGLGSAVLIRSMVVNPFFQKTVRIQTDHGHRVIDTGPYAWVRHPGYVGFAGWILATPMLLASAWAFVPAVLCGIGILVRTALEDRTLQAELPGYREYAARVRFRLIPGVW